MWSSGTSITIADKDQIPPIHAVKVYDRNRTPRLRNLNRNCLKRCPSFPLQRCYLYYLGMESHLFGEKREKSHFYHLGMSSGKRMPSLLSERESRSLSFQSYVPIQIFLKRHPCDTGPFTAQMCINKRPMENCLSTSGPCQPILVESGNFYSLLRKHKGKLWGGLKLSFKVRVEL